MTTPQDEELAQPRRRRAPVAIACGAAVVLAGGVAITAANASGASGSGSGSSASSSAPSGTSTTAPKPSSKPANMPKPKPHIDGTVTSVSGTRITVKDPEGFTRVIITSSSTKYASGFSASPKVGTVLHAEGTVDANGTSLDATSIGKRPTPPAGGPGGHGHGPGMGPGHGRPPAPPNGSKPTGSKPSGKPSGAPSGAKTSPSAATSS